MGDAAVQATFAMMGAVAVAVAGWAHFADRRRLRRVHVDRVGFMPWPAVAFAATAGAILLFALALLSR